MIKKACNRAGTVGRGSGRHRRLRVDRPDNFSIARSATIKAPPDKIYGIISDFRQWPNWSPWQKLDPGMKTTVSGPATGKGCRLDVGRQQQRRRWAHRDYGCFPAEPDHDEARYAAPDGRPRTVLTTHWSPRATRRPSLGRCPGRRRCSARCSASSSIATDGGQGFRGGTGELESPRGKVGKRIGPRSQLMPHRPDPHMRRNPIGLPGVTRWLCGWSTSPTVLECRRRSGNALRGA